MQIQPPLIASFVVRLFHAGESPEGYGQEPYRVTIRHVQTGEERQFHRLADAIAFMNQFTGSTADA